MAKKKVVKRKTVGRPSVEFDLDKVRIMGSLFATHKEMASEFECSVETIKNRLADETSDFYLNYTKGLCNKKLKIKQLAFQSAEKGNVTMQIFLLKALLGFSDQPQNEEEASHRNGLSTFLKTIVPNATAQETK